MLSPNCFGLSLLLKEVLDIPFQDSWQSMTVFWNTSSFGGNQGIQFSQIVRRYRKQSEMQSTLYSFGKRNRKNNRQWVWNGNLKNSNILKHSNSKTGHTPGTCSVLALNLCHVKFYYSHLNRFFGVVTVSCIWSNTATHMVYFTAHRISGLHYDLPAGVWLWCDVSSITHHSVH